MAMSVKESVPQPVLDDDTRGLVRRMLAAGLVEIDDIKKVVVSLMAESNQFTPQRLAEGLVGASLLTEWQSRKLLEGKARGFHLGSYRLLKPLGKGGMGVVFLAQHNVMNRLMALKILPPEATADAKRIARFKEEARACAQLDHPNIVQAFDFSQSDGKLFIVMEYIDGIDLHRAVARDGLMSHGTALDAITQATQGLAHAHQRGIIHRDIKPSNLLLRSDGVVKLSDLGLARIGWDAADGSENPGRLTGTADFVAPEQAINSRTVDSRADIYSLGCTWYFLLTGRPPFSGDTVHMRLAKHQTAPAPDVRAIRKDCPAAIAELILRMMAKRPSDRPASAVELLAQLERLSGQTGGSTLAKRLPSAQVAPAGNTLSDNPSSDSTFDDSGPLEEMSEVAAGVEVFDFGSLPAIDLSKIPTTQGPSSSLSATPMSPLANSPMSMPANNSAGNKSSRSTSTTDGNQQVLLGVGLAFAILALIAVVGVVYYQINQEPAAQPRLKTMEDGKGNVIVIRE
ncbi:Serine/threonine-protein kinase PrkC [Stieleria varia]|uniref:Serine/threonine-protein kinase PrkC n=2 Tax=Stieleria varia TaxID=2528005 RepID=A0A5C6AEB6_9BACT|nr:Serine/threonine-protein kinase PrkC [Stieleria varia]